MARSPLTLDSLNGRLLIVAGMSRGGTTYLYNELPRHPQILTTAEKELCYFGHNHDQGLGWWLSRCTAMNEGDIALDVCGLYFAEHEKAIPRISALDVEARIILTIRDPARWIFSIYEHYETAWDTPPFREFVAGCVWPRDGREIHLKFGNGRIRESVMAFARAFGERLLICDFKLLSQDPLGLFQRVEHFAGVRSFFNDENVERRKYNERLNSGSQVVKRLARVPGFRAAARLVPDSVRAPVRRLLERGSDGRKVSQSQKEYSDADLQWVEEIMSPDVAFYGKLFEKDSILTGKQLVERQQNEGIV
jgi:hypothetical protein